MLLHSPSFSCSSRNILDDFREAYYWLRQNTDEHARVMSWWDYGYQIAGMANRTTLVDNNTWNNSHIALVRAAAATVADPLTSLAAAKRPRHVIFNLI